MVKRTKFALFIFLFLSFQSLVIGVPAVQGYYTNMPASVVIGQPDFTSNSANQGGSVKANAFQRPYQAVMVGSKLVVSDLDNNRILIFNIIPTSNNASADVVIGQPDFSSSSANQGAVNPSANTLSLPTDLSTDGTKLFVADYANNRILIYNHLPTLNNTSADVVIGQTTMNSKIDGLTAAGLHSPSSVFFDNPTGKLFVSEEGNHRVLIYNQVPTTNGASADLVLGQADFTHGSANRGGGGGANTLKEPYGVRVSKGKLFVADPGNHRILIWNSIPAINGQAADVVIGQANMTSGSANQGGSPAANTLNAPYTYPVFSGDRLFIVDLGNNRLLIFNSIPTSNNASADVVLGQPNFTSNSVNQGGSVTANTLNDPVGSLSTNNKLIIADRSNNRFLIFDNLIREPMISLGSLEAAPEGKLRIRGNVRLGEWGRYFLSGSNLTVSVNGGGFGKVSSLYGNREDMHDNLYEFFHEFEPGSGGYTLLFHAFSSNTDEENAFYFSPFELKSVTSGNLPAFTFQVNSKYWTNIQDNLDSYEVSVKKEGTDTWTSYLTDIPVSPNTTNSAFLTTFDQTTGTITVRSNSKTLSGGKYQAKIVALDKWGHRQYSPSLEFTSTGLPSFKPNLTIYNGWFPLQVNKISGVTSNILSSFNPLGIRTSYTSSTSTPTFSGVVYTDATVTLLITNKNNTKEQKTYTAKATDSFWTITPTLYSNSIIDLYVQMGDKYNELPAFQITLNH